MDSAPSRKIRLRTARPRLRPTAVGDARRASEIQSDWAVTRMLRMAEYPPDPGRMVAWFADHEREWLAAEACRFAILDQAGMIGVVDVDDISNGEGALGYWLDRRAWGRGYAHEAAGEAVRFVLADVGLARLRSGRAIDNPASGRVLTKLGFTRVEVAHAYSRSRREEIRHVTYLLEPGAN